MKNGLSPLLFWVMVLNNGQNIMISQGSRSLTCWTWNVIASSFYYVVWDWNYKWINFSVLWGPHWPLSINIWSTHPWSQMDAKDKSEEIPSMLRYQIMRKKQTTKMVQALLTLWICCTSVDFRGYRLQMDTQHPMPTSHFRHRERWWISHCIVCMGSTGVPEFLVCCLCFIASAPIVCSYLNKRKKP